MIRTCKQCGQRFIVGGLWKYHCCIECVYAAIRDSNNDLGRRPVKRIGRGEDTSVNQTKRNGR